jgi:hypothetical protein
MSARIRSASRSVTRGSIMRSTRLPLTVSRTGTSPGPTARTPAVWASISAGDVAAVTALTTPAVFRKSRRLTENSPGFLRFPAMNFPLQQ